jgi:spore coat protein H
VPQEGRERQQADAPAARGQMGQGMTPGGQRGNLIEQMALKTNENKPDHSALFRLLEVLNNEPDETFRTEIEKVLDVDQVLRFLAVSTVLVHLDNYTGMGHNYYIYEVDGRFTILPWDLNMSFGGFDASLDRNGIINFLIDEPTTGAVADRPLVSRLLAVPAYLEDYHEYLRELIDGPFSYEVMESKIDALADLIRPYVLADTTKFTSDADFESFLEEGGQTDVEIRRRGMGINIGLKAFIKERIESIQKQLNGELPSTNNGQGNRGTMPGMGLGLRGGAAGPAP